MGDLKPISHKEFNEFIKGKEFKRRNNHKLKELKAKFGFKPMYDRRTLVISSNDMEPTEFDSMGKAAKAIDVGEGVIRYARKTTGETSLGLKTIRFFHKVVLGIDVVIIYLVG